VETYSRTEKLAGLFLFLSILAGIGAILFVSQGKGWFQKYQTYFVNLPESYNLQQGAPVKMRNAEIGSVTQLRFLKIGGINQVQVTIRVNAEYAQFIRGDSFAQVESPTIIGSAFLSIEPGTDGYEAIEPYGTIAPRAKKTLDDYLKEFQPEESLRKAKQFIDNMAYLSEQLKSHEQKLLGALKHFDSLLVAILEAKGTLGKLLMEKDFYNRLDSAVVKFENILKNSESISADVKLSASKVPNLLDKVNRELDEVKCILADLKKASGQLPELVDTTDEAIRTSQEVFDAVKANPVIKWTLPKPPPSRSIHVEPRNVP
jgi:ABC-type transporter Mla subunit MlaD